MDEDYTRRNQYYVKPKMNLIFQKKALRISFPVLNVPHCYSSLDLNTLHILEINFVTVEQKEDKHLSLQT